jgi:hypothetical protein
VVASASPSAGKSGHFRRQATIGRYFADFASHQHKLIVEVDGSGHGEAAKIVSDAERTAYLESRGYGVLRFWNNEVLNEIEGVMSAIFAALESSVRSAPLSAPPTPPHHALRARGEGNESVRAANALADNL